MKLSRLLHLIRWDWKINRGLRFDAWRAKLLLTELRLEQYLHRNLSGRSRLFGAVWYFFRFCGSIFQWFLCNSNIPGSVTIGRGLRLPHPQNIIIGTFTDIGEFCTIYQNVSIAWNGFLPTRPHAPLIGDRVLVGTSVIILGDITIGSDVLIGAGTKVIRSIPENLSVTNPSFR